jgi:hypothetical protein
MHVTIFELLYSRIDQMNYVLDIFSKLPIIKNTLVFKCHFEK